MRSHALLLSALLPLASAHFKLIYPAARGFDEDTLSTFPCGGQSTVSSNRTLWPISGGPIQLDMGHTSARVQVLLALGNDPGSNFDYVILPTVQEDGPQDFCIAGAAIHIPEGLNVTEGMNATVQVVTNGDPSGGLYNCADITFTAATLSTEEYSANCQNSTGVTASALTGDAVNANSSSSSSTTSAASSGTASATAGSTSTGAAALPTLAGWALGAMGVLAGAVVL